MEGWGDSDVDTLFIYGALTKQNQFNYVELTL